MKPSNVYLINYTLVYSKTTAGSLSPIKVDTEDKDFHLRATV